MDPNPHPYQGWLISFGCSTYPELYSKLETIAKDMIKLDRVPFSLSDLEDPPENKECHKIDSFMVRCVKIVNGDTSDLEAIKLIRYLKDNIPEDSYENPDLPDGEITQDEMKLIKFIFLHNIDLPGSLHNPAGHLQNYSSFFIDIYFGKYAKFTNYVNNLSKEKLNKKLNKREGYCKQSPIFAPIIGLRMVILDDNPWFTLQEKQEIKTANSLENENRHLDIMVKLIELGADVNAYDIYGFTPLHYAAHYEDKSMVSTLLKHGANPNFESRNGWRPLTELSMYRREDVMPLINIMVDYKAKLINKKQANDLRSNVELYGSRELAAKVRESHPREKEECEVCVEHAVKMCSACSQVYYCSPACQKLDWKLHKITCRKNKRNG